MWDHISSINLLKKHDGHNEEKTVSKSNVYYKNTLPDDSQN